MLGVLVETFETATTWDRLDALVADVTGGHPPTRCAGSAAAAR